jgi:hypothetical protein
MDIHAGCALANDEARFPRSTELHLADVTNVLAQDFADKVDLQVVRQIVRDSYARLVAHVPRTAEFYLEPWARSRLIGRTTAGREPTLTEMLTVPAQSL